MATIDRATSTVLIADASPGLPVISLVKRLVSKHRHRWYNPEDRTAYFHEENYPLEPLIRALWELWAKSGRRREADQVEDGTSSPKTRQDFMRGIGGSLRQVARLG